MFSYHPHILERYPTIRAGVIYAQGLTVRNILPGFAEEYQAEQRSVRSRLEGRSLAEVPSLAAWRRAFSSFGVKPTQYRSAAEALLRRLVKAGDIPSLNLLTDLGNLVAIRYALPVAVIDLSGVVGSILVSFAQGNENFVGLGAGPSSPETGEVIFVDEAEQVCARRWCWRQSAASATGLNTTDALFTVEAHHPNALQDVEQAVDDISRLLDKYQPESQSQAALLSPGNPAFTPAV